MLFGLINGNIFLSRNETYNNWMNSKGINKFFIEGQWNGTIPCEHCWLCTQPFLVFFNKYTERRFVSWAKNVHSANEKTMIYTSKHNLSIYSENSQTCRLIGMMITTGWGQSLVTMLSNKNEPNLPITVHKLEIKIKLCGQ